MQLSIILSNVGAIITLLFGFASLIIPKRIARGMFFELSGDRGINEFRVGMGGAFVGLSAFILYHQNELLFVGLAWFWLGAAIARLFTYFVDKPVLNKSYIAFFVTELVVASMLFF